MDFQNKEQLMLKLENDPKCREEVLNRLDELQDMYNKLLEQHAQAENFIDKLRYSDSSYLYKSSPEQLAKPEKSNVETGILISQLDISNNYDRIPTCDKSCSTDMHLSGDNEKIKNTDNENSLQPFDNKVNDENYSLRNETFNLKDLFGDIDIPNRATNDLEKPVSLLEDADKIQYLSSEAKECLLMNYPDKCNSCKVDSCHIICYNNRLCSTPINFSAISNDHDNNSCLRCGNQLEHTTKSAILNTASNTLLCGNSLNASYNVPKQTSLSDFYRRELSLEDNNPLTRNNSVFRLPNAKMFDDSINISNNVVGENKFMDMSFNFPHEIDTHDHSTDSTKLLEDEYKTEKMKTVNVDVNKCDPINEASNSNKSPLFSKKTIKAKMLKKKLHHGQSVHRPIDNKYENSNCKCCIQLKNELYSQQEKLKATKKTQKNRHKKNKEYSYRSKSENNIMICHYENSDYEPNQKTTEDSKKASMLTKLKRKFLKENCSDVYAEYESHLWYKKKKHLLEALDLAIKLVEGVKKQTKDILFVVR